MLLGDVERLMERLYIGADGAALRDEDRRKARQILAILVEVRLAVRRCSRHAPLVLVDAAAGKSYVGLLAAKCVLEPDGRPGEVVAIERDAARVAASARALERLRTSVRVSCLAADISDAAAWPDSPSIVVALHACGDAADVVIQRSIESGAHNLLLVPCCTGRAVAAARRAEARAAELGIPRHAPVRRRFIQALVDAERTWRLEAAGYETEVVEFVAATVTPHNLLWRARRVREPVRMARARSALDRPSR